MKLSEHFTLEELTQSATAARKGIDNTPSKAIIQELQKLAITVLEPLRVAWGAPIKVSSGYRCPKLNAAVGSKSTSQHVKGQAADIHTVSDSKADNKKLFDLAVRLMRGGKIKVGQIIDEYNYNWVHISTPGGHTNQILHIK